MGHSTEGAKACFGLQGPRTAWAEPASQRAWAEELRWHAVVQPGPQHCVPSPAQTEEQEECVKHLYHVQLVNVLQLIQPRDLLAALQDQPRRSALKTANQQFLFGSKQ